MQALHPIDLSRRTLLAPVLAAAAGSVWPLYAPARPAAVVALPPPDTRGGLPLSQALASRRSVRRFGAQSLVLAAVSQLLWAAQGITAAGGRRTAPSAGALYPIELHLVALRVEGLIAGAYRYLPASHALQGSDAEVTGTALQQAARGQTAVGAAAAVLVVTAVEARTAGKYGARAGRYIAFEAGAASQNLALQVAALGLGTVVIGAFDDAALTRLLRLPQGEQPIVLMPIGLPG